MSKIKKENIKKKSVYNKRGIDEKFAYRSVILSVVLAGVFLTISILFNSEIITILMNQNVFLSTLDVIIKVIAIMSFFFFIMASIGNYKELTGKPIDFKIILFIFVISVIQGFKNELVFSFSFVGLLLLVIYLYFVQDR
jgi:hypothetical protein